MWYVPRISLLKHSGKHLACCGLAVLGLKTTQDAKFYAASTTFDKFSNEDKTLVIQFTVKHEQKIDCGGGYVKVSGEVGNMFSLIEP